MFSTGVSFILYIIIKYKPKSTKNWNLLVYRKHKAIYYYILNNRVTRTRRSPLVKETH